MQIPLFLHGLLLQTSTTALHNGPINPANGKSDVLLFCETLKIWQQFLRATTRSPHQCALDAEAKQHLHQLLLHWFNWENLRKEDFFDHTVPHWKTFLDTTREAGRSRKKWWYTDLLCICIWRTSRRSCTDRRLHKDSCHTDRRDVHIGFPGNLFFKHSQRTKEFIGCEISTVVYQISVKYFLKASHALTSYPFPHSHLYAGDEFGAWSLHVPPFMHGLLLQASILPSQCGPL